MVEAANAPLYGWNAAKHIEPEQGIFSKQDKVNTQALREAQTSVQRDNKMFKSRGSAKRKGGTRWGQETRFPISTPYENAKVEA